MLLIPAEFQAAGTQLIWIKLTSDDKLFRFIKLTTARTAPFLLKQMYLLEDLCLYLTRGSVLSVKLVKEDNQNSGLAREQTSITNSAKMKKIIY